MQSPKFVDKLVKVYSRAGKEKWILVHIEVQGYQDRDFEKRMFTYFYRILDKYGKEVTAIAILTDKNKKYRPEKYEYNFLGTSIIYHFNTYKIIDQDEAELAKNDNPFAVVVLVVLLAIKAKSNDLSDEDLLRLKLEIARNLLKRNIDSNKIRALMTFLKLYVNFANSETSTKFDEEISFITENKKTMGIEEMVLERARKEGMEKGMEKGKKAIEKRNAEFVKNLIIKMGLSDTQIADIAKVPVDFVQKIRQKLKK